MYFMNGSDRNFQLFVLLHSHTFIFWAVRNGLLSELELHDFVKWKAYEEKVTIAFIAFLKVAYYPPREVDKIVPSFIASYR